jgi:hypothetical protein
MSLRGTDSFVNSLEANLHSRATVAHKSNKGGTVTVEMRTGPCYNYSNGKEVRK